MRRCIKTFSLKKKDVHVPTFLKVGQTVSSSSISSIPTTIFVEMEDKTNLHMPIRESEIVKVREP